MSKSEGVEVIDGKSPKADALVALGLRVSKVAVGETDDGGQRGEATIVGLGAANAIDLVGAIGQEVALNTAADDRRQVGTLRQIAFSAGKDGKPGKVTLKVTGGKGLDSFVGVAVKCEALQLPLDLKAGARPCRECGHGWNSAKPKKAANGHKRETGKCFCGCAGMKG